MRTRPVQRPTPSEQDGVGPGPASAAAPDEASVDRLSTAGTEDAAPADDAVPAAPASRRLEVGAALVALAFTGALAFLAGRIELRVETGGIDPRWWPELLGVLGVVLATALLVVAVLRPAARDDVEAATRDGWVRLLVTVALTALYLVTWPALGFLATTPVFLLALTVVFGGRGWRTLVLFPVLTTGFAYLLFHTLLKVPL